MDQDRERLKQFCDIVMDIYLHDPAFTDRGYIIGEGVNQIDVRQFVARVLDRAGKEMNVTQKELAAMIGSYASNWNAWLHENSPRRPIEGETTTWLLNEIIRSRSERTVREGLPPTPWPLRDTEEQHR